MGEENQERITKAREQREGARGSPREGPAEMAGSYRIEKLGEGKPLSGSLGRRALGQVLCGTERGQRTA